MVKRIVEEIIQALDNNLFMVALISALTLPDICGKAEYPELKTSARYKKWYQENMGKYEKPPEVHGIEMPYMDAEAVYLLRCLLLHEGNIDIKLENSIDHFTLVTESSTEYNIYGGDMSSIFTDPDGTEKRICRVNVQNFCRKMCLNVEAYYSKNKEKFSEDKYDIEDWDKVKEKFRPFELDVGEALEKMRRE